MKHRLLVAILVAAVVVSIFIVDFRWSGAGQLSPDVYVGIDAAYGDLDKIKQLVDNVSSYTNLFVVGCTAITQNTAKLEETCQYLYDRGLSFIIYQEDALGRRPFRNAASNWTETAKMRWGSNFLGFYYMDELGGKQLDNSSWSSIGSAKDYAEMASKYVSRVNLYVNWFKSGYTDWTDVSLYTSDYALYWYDFRGGYDTVFAQYGWNSSRELNTALCRGAATAQQKDWGAIITWKYRHTPYVESPTDLYNDMIYAYKNGAKYIIIFDSNLEYTDTILSDKHLDAIKQFWNYIRDNPRTENSVENRSAVLLPANYAYGLRGPDDKIWGLWPADNISYSLCVGINTMLQEYGSKLDIIYDDHLQTSRLSDYSNLIYWNDTSQFPDVMPTSISNDQTFYSLMGKYSNILIGGAIVATFVVTVIVLLVFKKTTSHKKAL